jgi:hypothetical protein
MRRGVGRPVIECTFNDGRRLAHNKIVSFDLGGKGEGKHCEGKQRQCGRRGGATRAGAELGGRQRGVHEPHGLVFGGSSDRKSRKRKKTANGRAGKDSQAEIELGQGENEIVFANFVSVDLNLNSNV